MRAERTIELTFGDDDFELYDKLAEIAQAKGASLQALIRQLLYSYLEK